MIHAAVLNETARNLSASAMHPLCARTAIAWCRQAALVFIVVILLTGSARAAEPLIECPRTIEDSITRGWPYELGDLALGIPPNAFSRMLQELKPLDWRESRNSVPAQLMTRTAASVGVLTPSLDQTRPLEPNYWIAGSRSEQALTGKDAAYRAASELYHQQKFAESVPAFDVVAADRNSPSRAAAAYSAARAQIISGQISDGIARIDAILKDDSLREVHTATYHLIGTLAYQTNDPRLRAAKYAQILEIAFQDPSGCDADQERQRLEELDDFSWYVGMYREAGPTVRVLDVLAELDPRFDLLRALAMPGPATGYGYLAASVKFAWPDGTLASSSPQFSWRTPQSLGTMLSRPSINRWAMSEGRNVTAHAREMWLKSSNFLWGLAFAQRTADPSEYPTIVTMIETLDLRPSAVPSEEARTALRLHFLIHAVRLALLDGKTESGAALIAKYKGKLPTNIPPPAYPGQSDWANGPVANLRIAVFEAPIVYFLRRNDFEAARDWTQRMRDMIGGNIGITWSALLATTFGEVFGQKIQTRFIFDLYEPLEPVFDLQSTAAMASLARELNTPAPARRALLGAAFVRLFALERQSEWNSLIPDLIKSYPELAEDLISVRGSRNQREQRFQAARLLLSNPGLGVYASTLHQIGEYLPQYREDARRLTAIDSSNPNDGNWWCPLSVDRLKNSLARDFIFRPTYSGIHGSGFVYEKILPGALPIADQVIASHPLLKGFDATEFNELSKVRSGTEQLARIVFDWSDGTRSSRRSRRESEQIAKALHDVVRATRHGCRRAGSTGDVSLEAFSRLHREFPGSEWTRRTPYWFNIPTHSR